MVIERRLLRACALAAVAVCVGPARPLLQAQEPGLSVRITSPLGRTGLSGPIRIVAQIQHPPETPLGEVRFYVDGKLLGSVATAPYAVEWVDDNPFERREIAVEAFAAGGHEARDAVQAVHEEGIERVVMLTGDNALTARRVGEAVGVDEVRAELLPEDKARTVHQLGVEHGKVAMVGDGINDAQAMAAATVGVALASTGLDVVIETADVVLMSGDLRGVPNAIALSQATLRNIRQNLVWAFGYNVVLIPVAAGALYPVFGILLSPMFAGLAMAMSSVSVLTNALRLRAFKAPMRDDREPMLRAPQLAPAE